MLLRAYNMHPFKAQVQHVDFQRVSKDRKIHMKVPLHFVNAEKSPGVKEQGGVPNHVVNELDIRACRTTCRSSSRSTWANLTVGHSMHVKGLCVPEGRASRCCTGARTRWSRPSSCPALVTEEEEAAASEAVPAAGEVPTTGAEPRPRKRARKLARAGGHNLPARGGEKAEKADKAEKKEKK